jgi:hypothetical protein
MQLILVPALLATGLALAGCSSQQLYSAGQGWQRNACNRLPDGTDRERCLADADRSRDAWQRATSGAR